jgi:hypothetical protein
MELNDLIEKNGIKKVWIARNIGMSTNIFVYKLTKTNRQHLKTEEELETMNFLISNYEKMCNELKNMRLYLYGKIYESSIENTTIKNKIKFNFLINQQTMKLKDIIEKYGINKAWLSRGISMSNQNLVNKLNSSNRQQLTFKDEKRIIEFLTTLCDNLKSDLRNREEYLDSENYEYADVVAISMAGNSSGT